MCENKARQEKGVLNKKVSGGVADEAEPPGERKA